MAQIVLPTEEEVWKFCRTVPVATKDYGFVALHPWGTQRKLLQEILAGKERGIHQYIVLKSRQVGCTTFLLLLTLMWMERFAGLQGLTVTDSDENKQYFRDLFLGMVDVLGLTPETEAEPQDPQRLRQRNQVQIVWPHGSRLLLQTAGRQTWRRLGVGRGLSFCHGTEFGLWSNGMKALTYLRSAFSDINPAALYVFEGTARGKNWFFDVWESAQKAKTIATVFLAWWLREDNQLLSKKPYGRPWPNGRVLWNQYGRMALTAKERDWDQVLRRREGVTLTPEQWAWRRWYREEKCGGSHRLADQEMPTVWEDAFSASQERPFLDDVTQQRLRSTVAEPIARYDYKWGTNLEETRPEPTERVDPMLSVWSPPDHRPVVVAAVPAHSAMSEDPTWTISVWAAALDADKLEQVAEFRTELNIGLQPFAWACMHLAGAYGAQHRCFILEIGGLGSGVLVEIRRLVGSGWGTTRRPGFLDVLGSVRHYIWRRPDSPTGAGALQWKSTPEMQGVLLQRFRDQLARGTVLVRSPALSQELSRLEGKGDRFDPAGDAPRGHLAMGGALAVESYASQLFPSLKRARLRGQPTDSVGGRMLHEFFGTLGRR